MGGGAVARVLAGAHHETYITDGRCLCKTTFVQTMSIWALRAHTLVARVLNLCMRGLSTQRAAGSRGLRLAASASGLHGRVCVGQITNQVHNGLPCCSLFSESAQGSTVSSAIVAIQVFPQAQVGAVMHTFAHRTSPYWRPFWNSRGSWKSASKCSNRSSRVRPSRCSSLKMPQGLDAIIRSCSSTSCRDMRESLQQTCKSPWHIGVGL